MSTALTPGTTSKVRRADGFFERGDQVTRLEAFVDAAFAFAVTLLAISIDSVPANREELILALKGVPAFACSFAVICMFWWEHNQWSRRFGLDDGKSSVLSLIYVGLVLVYVYPLKSMFSSMFAFLSNQYLPSSYAITGLDDLRWMFGLYAVAFSSLGLILHLLERHAWKRRHEIGLDPHECLALQRELAASRLHMIVGLISLTIAVGMPEGMPHWAYSMPGVAYCLLGLHGLIHAHYARKIAALTAKG